MLPNFFVIGAAKSGTTTLFNVLRQHPQIFCSIVKEIRFFSNDEFYAKGTDWYLSTYFAGAENYPARGEATPHYLSWSERVAPRIKDVYKDQDIKFIAIFRDPVKRAYSHYWHQFRLGNETLSFKDALVAEDHRLKDNWEAFSSGGVGTFAYYRLGCYATRLKPFLELFSPDQFLFLLQDELRNEFSRTMAKTTSFLGVDTSFEFRPMVSNPASMPKSRFFFNLLTKPSPLHRIARFLVPIPTVRSSIKGSLRRATLEPFRYPPMDESIEQSLRARYADEIKQLESLTHMDLSNWYAKS
jgi:hypothetical protein